MPFTTEIRSSLYCYADTFGFTLLWKLDSFMMIWGNVPTKSIMKIFDKIITIFLIQRHKGPSHNNEFNFINIVTNFPKLFHSISCLNIGIVSCSNCSHGCWLITCIWLRWVLKVRIWASRAIDTNVTSCSDMRTSMGFAHNSNNSNTTRCSNRLGLEQRSELMFIVFGKRTNNFYKFWCFRYSIFLGDIMDECIQDNLFSLFIGLDEFSDDFGNILKKEYILIDFILGFFIRFVGGLILHISTLIIIFFYMMKVLINTYTIINFYISNDKGKL